MLEMMTANYSVCNFVRASDTPSPGLPSLHPIAEDNKKQSGLNRV